MFVSQLFEVSLLNCLNNWTLYPGIITVTSVPYNALLLPVNCTCVVITVLLNEISTYEISTYEISTYEISTYEISTYEISTYEISTYEISTYDISTYEISTYDNVISRQLSLVAVLISEISTCY